MCENKIRFCGYYCIIITVRSGTVLITCTIIIFTVKIHSASFSKDVTCIFNWCHKTVLIFYLVLCITLIFNDTTIHEQIRVCYWNDKIDWFK